LVPAGRRVLWRRDVAVLADERIEGRVRRSGENGRPRMPSGISKMRPCPAFLHNCRPERRRQRRRRAAGRIMSGMRKRVVVERSPRSRRCFRCRAVTRATKCDLPGTFPAARAWRWWSRCQNSKSTYNTLELTSAAWRRSRGRRRGRGAGPPQGAVRLLGHIPEALAAGRQSFIMLTSAACSACAIPRTGQGKPSTARCWNGAHLPVPGRAH